MIFRRPFWTRREFIRFVHVITKSHENRRPVTHCNPYVFAQICERPIFRTEFYGPSSNISSIFLNYHCNYRRRVSFVFAFADRLYAAAVRSRRITRSFCARLTNDPRKRLISRLSQNTSDRSICNISPSLRLFTYNPKLCGKTCNGTLNRNYL